MEKFKSRCHFSIIFQSIWQFWAIILVFLLQQLDSLVDIIRDIKVGDVGIEGLIGLGAIIIVSIVIFTIQFLRWKKTWIIVRDNLIIYERNTLNRVNKTIALETVSTVNIERNIFDRIIGTCRIKMDTNSMTTAHETDINILLKEDVALEFQRLVMSLMGGKAAIPRVEETSQVSLANAEHDEKVFHTDTAQLAKHWLYTLPILSALIVVCCVIGSIGYIVENSFDSFIIQILGGFLALAFVVIGALFNVLKQFFSYFDYTIYREGDDLHIKHGLLKLREYTVPITKINAILIDQPPLARLFKKYTVKVKTVGIGDEREESAYLCMAMSKEEMLEQMSVILPEYSFEEMLLITPEEAVGMKVRMFLSIKWHLLFLGSCVLLFILDIPLWCMAIPIALDLYANLLYYLSHKTAGYAVNENGITISNGYFARHFTLCSFGKTEYISLKTHPASKHCNVCNGTLHMLDYVVEMPYIHRDLANNITDQMIRTKRQL